MILVGKPTGVKYESDCKGGEADNAGDSALRDHMLILFPEGSERRGDKCRFGVR